MSSVELTAPYAMLRPVADVLVERKAQVAKWGEQNHPDGTGSAAPQSDALAEAHRQGCDAARDVHALTWRHILLEEVYEAMAEEDPNRLREELIQVAAVAAAWVEAIDRRLSDAAAVDFMAADETPLPPTPRPMVAEDFSTGAGPGVTTLPMTENEDGEHLGFGHIDPVEFALAANVIDKFLDVASDTPWAASDVEHRWAVTTLAPEDGDGEWACEYVKAGTPGAWPITVVRP